MIRLFFITIYRNFIRNQLSTFLNLTNLVIGFTTFILLCLIVNHELNYDNYNENYDRIYRVQTKQEDSSPTNFCAYSPSAYRYRLLADLPEIEQVLLMKETSGLYFNLSNGSQLFEEKGYWCENSFFDIFTVKLIEGSLGTVLTNPNTIVLSKKLSNKIFPSGNVVGKQVIIGKQVPLTVTGVYGDLPENSHLTASYLMSMPTYVGFNGTENFYDNWHYINCDNYVLLKNGADPQQVDEKIKGAFKNVKNLEKSTPYLHPLSKLHVSPNNQSDFIIGLSALSLAAALILILSCCNYVNLSLANSTRRAREIGIKKVVGASRKTLAIQFMGETLIMTFVAMTIGLVLAQLFSPVLNVLLQNDMSFHLLREVRLLQIIFFVSILAGVLSGLYPSLVFSAYHPVKVLKGNLFQNNRKTINLKKVLIVSQFAITIFMLVICFILHAHINFILNKDLGFDYDHILHSQFSVKDNVHFETIQAKLLQHPEIAATSLSFSIPFVGNNGGYITWEDARFDEKVMISQNRIDYDFISTMGLKIIKGRNFSKEYPSDEANCIVNETAINVFGWDDPIGRRISLNGKTYPVIGIVKDFHPYTPHNRIPPYVMLLAPNGLTRAGIMSVRFTSGNEQKAKQIINEELQKLIPSEAFEFKSYNEVLTIDVAISFWKLMKRIYIFFSVVTILVVAMGLLGLMIFSTQSRSKEIGIRKVLGSTVMELYRQLSSEVLILLALSLVFAFPAAIYVYLNLPGAYKEPLSAFNFLMAFGIVAAITILTISFHVLKVALSNPVDALRHE